MQTRITFTGVDARTDLQALVRLTEEHPDIEFGILVARSRTGLENRYPDISILDELILRTPGSEKLNLACHVCGSLARETLRTGDFRPLDDFLLGGLCVFDRVQLNVSSMTDLPETIDLCAPDGVEVILQQHPDREPLIQKVAFSNTAVSVLYDASGGLGIDSPVRPVKADFRTGYAGGINPSNVKEKLATLENSGLGGDFWIDMETGIRTDDWFDLGKVKQVLENIG